MLAAGHYDLVLLDLSLHDSDGLTLLTTWRRTSDIPIILVTGRGDEADRIVGLKLGADDYVVKPFSVGELGARIESVLRRARPRPSSDRLDHDELTVDLRSREVRVDGQAVDVTPREFDLLAFLAGSPGQVFSREQLLRQVWDSSSEWQSRTTVTEHVRRLRGKIEADPDTPRWIITARGVGYRFQA
jgi:DNA-binding response OmpR family regulator